jgi:hypothetical protein
MLRTVAEDVARSDFSADGTHRPHRQRARCDGLSDGDLWDHLTCAQKELRALLRPRMRSTGSFTKDELMTGDVESNTVFGASACIAFRFDGTLEQLAEKLADALNLKSFDIETDQDPPHKMIGSAEALGWEIWLEEDLEESPHCFRLRMQTEHSLKEEFDGDMHDLSPWLARLISMLINVDALPSIDADSGRS